MNFSVKCSDTSTPKSTTSSFEPAQQPALTSDRGTIWADYWQRQEMAIVARKARQLYWDWAKA